MYLECEDIFRVFQSFRPTVLGDHVAITNLYSYSIARCSTLYMHSPYLCLGVMFYYSNYISRLYSRAHSKFLWDYSSTKLVRSTYGKR